MKTIIDVESGIDETGSSFGHNCLYSLGTNAPVKGMIILQTQQYLNIRNLGTT